MLKKLAERFHRRFRGLERAHGTFLINNKKQTGKRVGKATTLHEPVTDELWEKHLQSKDNGIGVVPIDDEAECNFGAIDIDAYEDGILPKIEKKIQESKFPLVLCRTKSGGAHLYLFLSEPVPAALVRSKLLEWAIFLGHPNVEIFPKQVQLAGPQDVGNWINMPYSGGSETDRYAILDGKKLSPEEFLDYADQKIVSEDMLTAISVDPVEFLEGSPPCLEQLGRQGFPEGSRNKALFNLGILAKKKFGDDWAVKLEEMNRRFLMPPLGSAEVQQIVKSIGRKEYFYTCNDNPICSACNKVVCKTREFGIGKVDDDPGVLFGGLTKVETQPPTWIIDVDGIRIEIQNTQDLLSQDVFRVLCMERLNKLPNKIKAYSWEKLIVDLLKDVEIITAPSDASSDGQFVQLIEAFCTSKASARERDEILQGKPWYDKERFFFRSIDLMKFLDQNKFREITSSRKAWSIMRTMGAEHTQFQIKGKCIKVWSLPSEVFSKQTEEFTAPKITGENF